MRWHIYHCWPVWSGFFVLMSLVLFGHKLTGGNLMFLGFIWFMLSIGLFIHGFDHYQSWMNISQFDRIKLFPLMMDNRASFQDIYAHMERPWIVGVALAFSLLGTVFLVGLQIYETVREHDTHLNTAFKFFRILDLVPGLW